MRLFTSITRAFKFALQNFFRNFWLSLATITIFLLTLVTINMIILVTVIANSLVKSVEERVEVTFHFTPETSLDLAQSAQEYLLGFDQVKTVYLRTADENLDKFKTSFGDDDVILSSLDEVGDNPFGHSVIISAESSKDFPFIIEAIETPEFTDSIKDKDYIDSAETIAKIERISEQVKWGGIGLSAFFVIVAGLIIFNTIRVAIYVHRDEIGIMKLVGANDWFVRSPFIIEALLYSLLAVAVVTIVILLLSNAVQAAPEWYFDRNTIHFFTENAILVFGLQALGLSFLSILTTSIAMHRYLKV